MAFHPQKCIKLKVFWGFGKHFFCSNSQVSSGENARRRIGVWSLQGSGSKSWNATHKKQAQRAVGHRWGRRWDRRLLGVEVKGSEVDPKMYWTSPVFFQICFGMFTPKIGEDEAILMNIFQMAWFNHQLVVLLRVIFQPSWKFRCKLAGGKTSRGLYLEDHPRFSG